MIKLAADANKIYKSLWFHRYISISVDGGLLGTYVLANGGYVVFGSPDKKLHSVTFTVNGGTQKLR